MGDLFDINSRKKLTPVETFSSVINSPETYEGVRNRLRRRWHLPDLAITKPVSVVFLNDGSDLEYGTVHPVPNGKSKSVVATHENFPDHLSDALDLPRKDALRLAASFVISFGVIRRGIESNRQGRIPTFRASMRSELWDEKYHSTDASNKEAVTYRADGMVMREIHGLHLAQSVEGLVSGGELPGHIAGIVNPLAQDQFAQLHFLIKRPRINQTDAVPSI